MSLETLQRQEQENGAETEPRMSDLQQRANAVRARARKFIATLVNTKTASQADLAMWESYIAGMRMKEDGYDGIADRELTFNGKNGEESVAEKMERSALTLFSRFHADINKAAQNKWISQASLNKWVRRFEDPSASYKDREKWVMQEMPAMMERWRDAAEERKKLISNDAFKALVAKNPEFSDIVSEDKFLGLHYDKRRSLLADARASLLSTEKGQNSIYDEAKRKLQSAASLGIMNSGKVGMWLERIFSANASPAKIEAFVNGSGATSLNALMKNWAAVSQRFDKIERKFKERFEGTGIRGFQPVSKTQFLSMHYEQRLQYVNQAEDRLDAGNDVENEAPILLKLRHAMDTKDWESAADLIGQAKTSHLSEKDFKRLKSMESYVKQFNGAKEIKEQSSNVTDARKRIDALVEEIGQHHSEVQPMVLRLLKSPHANRNIHQFRWIVYNNDWCTTHGYLNHEIAKKGASAQNEEATRERARTGEDIGRHDVISHSTDGREHTRKSEHADHKATYRHVNVSSGGATQQTAEWLEHEQNPKVLYWTTFCAHENGEPKNHNWHRDLFANLTELRSLARTVNSGGFMYAGPGHALISMN